MRDLQALRGYAKPPSTVDPERVRAALQLVFDGYPVKVAARRMCVYERRLAAEVARAGLVFERRGPHDGAYVRRSAA
jgi:hypothetical protein